MRKTGKIALCGVVAALSLAVLFLTGVIPIATVALPAIAGVFTIAVVAELGVRYGFAVYAVCAVLSFLVAPDREAALFYVLFFGYYPTACALFLRVKQPWLRLAAKFLLFNAAMGLETLAALYILRIPFDSMFVFGKFGIALIWVLLNAVFFLYDRCMPGLVALYYRSLHKPLTRIFGGRG